jgi:hypothetical protein
MVTSRMGCLRRAAGVGEQAVAIDTLTNNVIATIPIGQATQALVYVPNAMPDGAGTDNRAPLGSCRVAHHC